PHCRRVPDRCGLAGLRAAVRLQLPVERRRGDRMRRREFITLLGGAAAWPLMARAQQARRVYRVGILAVARDLTGRWKKLLEGLRDHGYVEGQTLVIEWRYSEGQAERWSELADELVGLKVDAIVVNTTPAALAAKKATSTIPIVIQ